MSLNSSGDHIAIVHPIHEGNYCSFGTLNNMVLAPNLNQSLSIVGMSDNGSETTHVSFAKDNLPFEGVQNNTDIKGTFNGFVYDSNMNPLAGVELDKDPDCISFPDIITDENGWFETDIYAFNYDFHIHLAAIVFMDTIIAIEPEQINRYDFIFESYSGFEDEQILPPHFNISNSPNPFNPVTTISFGKILEQPAILKIYDSKGRLVDELNCRQGLDRISWNAENTASGVSFYNLIIAGEEAGNGKMLLLK